MLVDDNDTDNIINEKIILSSHFAQRVMKFSAAEDALEFLKTRGVQPAALPEYIFLDMNMPKIDGFGFLKIFREMPAGVRKKCKIILLSAYDYGFNLEKANRDNFVAKCLFKPLKQEYLHAIQIQIKR